MLSSITGAIWTLNLDTPGSILGEKLTPILLSVNEPV